MNVIELYNKAVSKAAINVYSPEYEALVGAIDFTPEVTIVESKDYNCGAFCNELEFARTVAESYTASLAIDTAENSELDLLVKSFVKLERLVLYENDQDYRNRFKALAVQGSNPVRTTPLSIRKALSYFVPFESVHVREMFDLKQYYFEVRLTGISINTEDITFVDQNFMDNSFIGGVGVGKAVVFAEEIIDRIRAAGIEHNLVVIDSDNNTILSDSLVGSTRITILADSNILAIGTDTILSDAIVTILGTGTIGSDATIA